MTLTEKFSRIVGKANVLTGADAAPYGKDWMGAYVALPRMVLRPASTDEVSAVMRLANETATPVVPICGNTGLVGGTYAPDAVMISLARMNRIKEIKTDTKVAIVQAGVILSDLHDAVANVGLAFPLLFGARGSAMIGGNLSTNAGGSNVVRYGNTRALCLGLEVVLADGRVMNLMSELHKDNTGYDLKDLFIGAEGTLGIITGAVLKLVPKPLAYASAMVSATSVPDALELLNNLQRATTEMVEAFEFMPRSYMERLRIARPDLVPPLGYDREVTIFIELGATAPRDADVRSDGSVPVQNLLETVLLDMIEAGLADDVVVAQSEAERRKMWAIREAAAEITLGRKPYIDADLSVPLGEVAPFLEKVHQKLAKIDPDAETITVGHLGDGNLHFTVWPSVDDPNHKAQIQTMTDQVTHEMGGSFSAEHGIGLSKLGSMERGKDPVALAVMQSIKDALDPNGIMNPGKVLPANRP